MNGEVRMKVREALPDDPEAIARVEALIERLKRDADPYSARIPEATKRLADDPDLVVLWLLGRDSGIKEAMRALLGHDHVTFDTSPGPARVWFSEETGNLDWWRKLSGQDPLT